MRYHERVQYKVMDHPTVHSIDFVFGVRIVPMLPAFEWHLLGTWAQYSVGGQNEVSIVFLPRAQGSLGVSSGLPLSSGSHAHSSTRQLVLLKPGARANTTQFTYVFQLDFGSHSTALERVLPSMRVETVRRHRALVTSIKKYFERQVQAWLNDVEDDTAWRDAQVDEMRQGGHVYTEEEAALIAQGKGQLDAVADGKGTVRSFRHGRPSTQGTCQIFFSHSLTLTRQCVGTAPSASSHVRETDVSVKRDSLTFRGAPGGLVVLTVELPSSCAAEDHPAALPAYTLKSYAVFSSRSPSLM
jgi:hypothetical protein